MLASMELWMEQERVDKLREQVDYVIAHPYWSAHPIDPALVDELLTDYANLVSFRQQILEELGRWVSNYG